MNKMYDYLIVGSGLFGATFARLAKDCGKRCLVVDRRQHVGGNVYCEDCNGIIVHKYGPHIFHTNNEEIWNFVNKFVTFNQFMLNVIASYKGKLYNLPFNMHMFYQMWNVTKPDEAISIIEQQRCFIENPHNLEEQAMSLVGRDIYEKIIKGYTEKQWGRPCKKLPANIIKRLPVRYSYNNNYFNDRFQGIPKGGYNKLIDALLKGIECRINCDFIVNREELESIANRIVYTGSIDEFFNYKLGCLEYRNLRFEQETLFKSNYQGNAVVNYTDVGVPYTRIVEHKWFDVHNTDSINAPYTIITREYPVEFISQCREPFYPINDERNTVLYEAYKTMAREACPNVVFAGRQGAYRYYDMDKIIAEAIALAKKIV